MNFLWHFRVTGGEYFELWIIFEQIQPIVEGSGRYCAEIVTKADSMGSLLLATLATNAGSVAFGPQTGRFLEDAWKYEGEPIGAARAILYRRCAWWLGA